MLKQAYNKILKKCQKIIILGQDCQSQRVTYLQRKGPKFDFQKKKKKKRFKMRLVYKEKTTVYKSVPYALA